jgi:AcrB/AcrD/AcrF family
LAFGAGGEFRSPMALAVIGGLLTSTLLSLVFVPAVFALVSDVAAVTWRFGTRLVSSGAEAGKITPPPLVPGSGLQQRGF